ncbi:3'(2'),5'-bisphosphate nucleotidase CysQ [Phyllobacterium sp. 0TCS1.6C]|uniref:3'(2'),5'-bisphosphate nucleotidase CysQ n=1 Tax=unclassified Phyllobacterium TaxID=2638441 RepID=UPI0022647C30|nr:MULTISPECIES: 3'(2'),5'-bisphosphate nucleotidase CysQ [unclassified Phyllobacterium]MCX8281343.1 3'(2'),5'-bisphosphate nucleotidase CysQ [Phyllobacterium sp. 0TCS1.6C]MCX8296001.1 3'(2'),5'-bisphosphate nucleotidase CysQ [Phyllobacterium sp. 0TCS1.6A]
MTDIATATIDHAALLRAFERMAIDAGQEILRIYEEGCDVLLKEDKSPVTAADHAAEAIILEALRRATPDIPIVAEEEISGGHVPGELGSRFYLVDPLDGTREFVNRNGDFTVNIALIEHGAPVLGVVYAPVRGWLFLGGPDGAEEAGIGEGGKVTGRRAISCRKAPAQLIAVASRSHRTPETNSYLEGFTVGECVSVGSSIKFGLLARGEADIYPRLGRTMEWDTAAGDAVLRAAGGATLTLDGQLLTYGRRNQANDADFANPGFVARGRL